MSTSGIQLCATWAYVGIIKDGNHDPVEDDKSSEDMNLSPPWDHKRAPNPCDLRPVKRNDTHSQTCDYPEELIDRDIPRGNPANPRKHGECREQEPWIGHIRKRTGDSKIVTDELTGEEEEKEGSSEEVHEEPVATNAAAFLIFFGMESVQQGAGNQVLRPHHASWPDEESSTESGQPEPSQLRSQHKRNFKTETISDAIVDLKNHNGVQGVWRGDSDVGHNEHQRMFLDTPGPRVERKFESTEPSRQPVGPSWDDESKEFSNRVRNQDQSERRYRRCW